MHSNSKLCLTSGFPLATRQRQCVVGTFDLEILARLISYASRALLVNGIHSPIQQTLRMM